MILEINNTTKNKINTKILKKAVDVFGRKMNVTNKQVSVAFVSANKIRQLNKTYRGVDKVTDVLSFAEDGDEKFLGEVIICYSQIKKQAREQKTTIQNELTFVFIHGLLHLVGYDDRTEKGRKEMEEMGVKLCESIIGRKK